MRPSARLAAGKATIGPVDSAHSEDCVLKIVLITIKGFCDQGLERWEPSYGRRQPSLLANLRAKHNLWDTTISRGFVALRSKARQRTSGFPRVGPRVASSDSVSRVPRWDERVAAATQPCTGFDPSTPVWDSTPSTPSRVRVALPEISPRCLTWVNRWVHYFGKVCVGTQKFICLLTFSAMLAFGESLQVR
jgi:hypothetical protein